MTALLRIQAHSNILSRVAWCVLSLVIPFTDTRVLAQTDALSDAEALLRSLTPLSATPAKVERVETRITAEMLAGDWGYNSTDRDGKPIFRRQVTINADGTAYGYSYFANKGKGRVTISGVRINIVTNADWGDFSGKPYLKW